MSIFVNLINHFLGKNKNFFQFIYLKKKLKHGWKGGIMQRSRQQMHNKGWLLVDRIKDGQNIQRSNAVGTILTT